MDTHDATILALARTTRQLAGDAARATGLSRVAVSRRIKRLADTGYLQRHGSGTRQTYSPGTNGFWTLSIACTEKSPDEFALWEAHLHPMTGGLQPNVMNMAQIVFTELVNNVRDHAKARTLAMGAHIHSGRLQIAVMDDGVGIFRNIAQAQDLFDDRLAVLELAKGKYTTAASGHSGMGIFVSSRLADGFCVYSRGITYAPRTPRGVDLSFGWIDWRPYTQGTIVLVDIALDSTRTAQSIYERYLTPDEVGGEAFHTTEVPVKLAELSSQLVSRSQGKWVVARATQFQTVILDFAGVEFAGQAFLDEVFRVFATAHPQVRLVPVNLAPQVERNLRTFAPGALAA
ncbi:STAS-like domain-containing protein [Ramlibacter sp.]|uniref:STAS-like domain-containing protein n=1 Tax=Ramlibacter sp. TaxID=1917967 RepID=UPI003D0EBF61